MTSVTSPGGAVGSPITGFDKLGPASASASCRAPCRSPYVIDTLGLQPVKFPDYNTVYASLKTRQIDAWVAPSQQARGTVRPGDPRSSSRTPSAWTTSWPTRCQREPPLIDALNAGLDAVIADGTWSRLYSEWVPRALPPGWKPGSKAAPVPRLPDFAAIAASQQKPPRRRSRRNPAAVVVPGLGALQEGHPGPVPHRPPQHLILTFSASIIGLLLGMVLAVAGISRARWLRW